MFACALFICKRAGGTTIFRPPRFPLLPSCPRRLRLPRSPGGSPSELVEVTLQLQLSPVNFSSSEQSTFIDSDNNSDDMLNLKEADLDISPLFPNEAAGGGGLAVACWDAALLPRHLTAVIRGKV